MESRRSFLKFLAGGAALALTPVAKFIPALEPTVVSLGRYATFTELVTETLRQHPQIAANILQHNALFKHLQKVHERVEKEAGA
jgi:hypothetical protein